MWTYSQSTGAITGPNGERSIGYSGHDNGKNNPALEASAGIGPIPRGKWHIVRWDAVHTDKGPIVTVLAPAENNALGRSDFLIHGDSASHPGEASHGCIIASRDTRLQWRASNDRDLMVTL